jgi:hypothetical protein
VCVMDSAVVIWIGGMGGFRPKPLAHGRAQSSIELTSCAAQCMWGCTAIHMSCASQPRSPVTRAKSGSLAPLPPFSAPQLRALLELIPISLFVKALLKQHGLNEVFTGGISSFSVVLMTLAHLLCEGLKADTAPPQPCEIGDGGDAQQDAFLASLSAQVGGGCPRAAQPWFLDEFESSGPLYVQPHPLCPKHTNHPNPRPIYAINPTSLCLPPGLLGAPRPRHPCCDLPATVWLRDEPGVGGGLRRRRRHRAKGAPCSHLTPLRH